MGYSNLAIAPRSVGWIAVLGLSEVTIQKQKYEVECNLLDFLFAEEIVEYIGMRGGTTKAVQQS